MQLKTAQNTYEQALRLEMQVEPITIPYSIKGTLLF